jgi:hypothetical protein
MYDPKERMSEPELELTVVMPVFNEAPNLRRLLPAWRKLLDESGATYEFHALDDGSRDDSLEMLRAYLGSWPELRVATGPNRGHGPTIRRGYAEASACFVLQIDSDDEIPAECFEALWRLRTAHDLVLVQREHAPRAWSRRLVSSGARAFVRLAFGAGVADPNAPTRLMRGTWLREALVHVPENAFTPNLLLTALALREGARIVQVPVSARPRPAGTSTLRSGQLLRASVRALSDGVRLALDGRGR